MRIPAAKAKPSPESSSPASRTGSKVPSASAAETGPGLSLLRALGRTAAPPTPSPPPKNVPSDVSILPPGDAYEREADAVADHVLRRPMPRGIGDPEALPITPLAPPPATGPARSASRNGWAHRIRSSPGGRPMDGDIRGFMESRFHMDFGRVNIHADAEAARMNRELGARAFTTGRDIFFNAGQYRPATPSGRKLLAHELTHVLQQSGRADAGPQRQIQMTPEDDMLAELGRLPGAGEEGLDSAERRRRTGLARDRRERLRELFEALSPAEARTFLERLSSRHEGDELSERFHDILSRTVRAEMLGIMRRIGTAASERETARIAGSAAMVYDSPRYIDNYAQSVSMEMLEPVHLINFTLDDTRRSLRLPEARLHRTAPEEVLIINQVHPTVDAANQAALDAPAPDDFPQLGIYTFYEYEGLIFPNHFTPVSIPRIYDGILRKEEQMRAAARDAEAALWGVALGLALRLLFSAFAMARGSRGGRTPVPPEETGAAATGLAARARAMVRALREAGEEVIVNLGGTGARHEPPNAINVNPNTVAPRRGIPNLIQEEAEQIGTLFETGSVDRVVGHRLAHETLRWDEVATGAHSILRPGGRVEINLRWAHAEELGRMMEAFRRAGFRELENIGDVVFRCVKP